jgi:hypothetical protein
MNWSNIQTVPRVRYGIVCPSACVCLLFWEALSWAIGKRKKLYKKPAAVDISAAVDVVQLLCNSARTAAAAACAVTNLTGAVYAKVYRALTIMRSIDSLIDDGCC